MSLTTPLKFVLHCACTVIHSYVLSVLTSLTSQTPSLVCLDKTSGTQRADAPDYLGIARTCREMLNAGMNGLCDSSQGFLQAITEALPFTMIRG